MMLRAVLLAAAGAASIAYLARRPRPSHIARELSVDELDREVRAWLPRLPHLGYIRLTVDGWPLLRLSGDPGRVRLQLLDPAGDRRTAFRAAATALELPLLEPDGHSLFCELPGDADAVGRALATVLHDVFDLGERDRLRAEVPNDPGAHAR
ncbi:MAG TPA: hypothetical protein VF210_12715 [Pseudomonadales bacterium]